MFHNGAEKTKNRLAITNLFFVLMTIRESLVVVGVAGLEPAASWSRTKHATKLRYTPTDILLVKTL